jgi:2-keto-4-pentenoate hydratase/2-oxohepta-3-ene-1,7-dioic acid hydratase in catechol pathway
MRIVSFSSGGSSGVGLVEGDHLRPLASTAGELLSLRAILEANSGADHRDRLIRQFEAVDTDAIPLNGVAFLPVVADPRAIWCAALTFDSHVTEAAGREAPTYPLFFLRVAASQTGHLQPLVRPAVSEKLDYEGELAVVIGRTARHVPVADALDYVAGYSCYNEGSVRDWQRHTPQITPGKNFFHSGSFGPWLVTPDEFGDPYSHSITTRVNGEIRQQESVDALLFRIEYLIHYLSTICPLEPGDVIVCGTPGGVGMRMDPPVFLREGDEVTVEIDGIGTLRNSVVQERPNATPTWQAAESEVMA